jgi:hypothetical protein
VDRLRASHSSPVSPLLKVLFKFVFPHLGTLGALRRCPCQYLRQSLNQGMQQMSECEPAICYACYIGTAAPGGGQVAASIIRDLASSGRASWGSYTGRWDLSVSWRGGAKVLCYIRMAP